MQTEIINYPWAKELEKTVIHSLTTSFGLDFLLFKDKNGGDVDTIYNVRQGVWATEQAQKKYEQRENYGNVKGDYHSHSNYKETGQRDKQLHQQGKLHDRYSNKILAAHENRNLDHVISAKEIHDDPGRNLSGLNGIDLANQSFNLQTTEETINKSKKQTSVEDYLKKLPNLIQGHEENVKTKELRLANMPRDTPENKSKAKTLESDIRKSKEKIKKLKNIDAKEMLKRDKEARDKYNLQINKTYYTSSQFFKKTATASAVSGLKMGTRQMLGLVLAEVWFELREQIPLIFDKLKKEFKLEFFIDSIQKTLKGIWQRVQTRFKDFLTGFKDGVFAGIFSSLTTTLFNIFATTQKMAIKIIREMWGQIVKAIKLIVFNPDKLSFVDLSQAVISVLSTGVSAVAGTMVYAELVPILSFPFGSELAGFAGALVTGVLTLGLNYFLLHSSLAKKAWDFIESIMPHAGTVKKFEAINAELDRYLTELGRIEFNLDVEELAEFSRALSACSNEMERGQVLKEEIQKRGIELPYEMGNADSTRKWLASLI